MLEMDRVRTPNAALERKLEIQREHAEASDTRLQQVVLELTAAHVPGPFTQEVRREQEWL